MSLADGPRANIEVKARLLDLDRAIRVACEMDAREAGAADETGPRCCDYEVVPAPRGERTRELLEASLWESDFVPQSYRELLLGARPGS